MIPRLVSRRSAFIAGAAAAFAVPASMRSARAADRVTLQVGQALEDDAGVVFYGIATGVFAKLGLDVVVSKTASGSAGAAAVAGGTLALAKGSIVSAVAAHARGVPFLVIAPSMLYSVEHPVSGLLVRADSPFRTGRDLNGKTIGVSSLIDSRVLSIKAWVDQNGGDTQTLKFTEIPSATVVAALDTGRIDATSASDPLLFDALASGRVRSIAEPNGAVAKRFVITGWFTTRDYTVRNADAVRRFKTGYAACAAYANAHPKEMAQYIAPFTGIDEARLSKWDRAQIATSLEPADIQPVIDVAAKYHLIDKAFPAAEMLFTG
jgi:NitT/TauT family transport system substrate-binding protein